MLLALVLYLPALCLSSAKSFSWKQRVQTTSSFLYHQNFPRPQENCTEKSWKLLKFPPRPLDRKIKQVVFHLWQRAVREECSLIIMYSKSFGFFRDGCLPPEVSGLERYEHAGSILQGPQDWWAILLRRFSDFLQKKHRWADSHFIFEAAIVQMLQRASRHGKGSSTKRPHSSTVSKRISCR